MSRIDDLIAEHCPDGVEYKPLAEVGQLFRGRRFVKDDMIDAGIPCIHYGEIYTKYGVSATQSYAFLNPDLARRLRTAKPGDVVIATAGETVEDIGKAVAWLGQEEVVIHDACYVFRGPLDPKYVSYFLRTQDFRSQAKSRISSSKISSISLANLGRIRIPVPPFEVQREIVRILDTFTQLEAELEAELEARRIQYEHYREELVFGDQSIEQIKLGEVAMLSDSRISAKEVDMHTYTGVDNLLQEYRGRVESSYVPDSGTLTQYLPGDVLIGNIRPYLKKVWLADHLGGTNGDVLAVRILDRAQEHLLDRYLYFVLTSQDFLRYTMKHARGAKMPRGSKTALLKYSIPMPSID